MGGGYSQILPGLYQGGADVLDDSKFWEKHKFTHVVSLGISQPKKMICELNQLKVLHIEKGDFSSTDLSTHFDETTQFIHKARSGGGVVYVHCAAGVSRSSTITLAYLMSWMKLDYIPALNFLSLQRQCASPNTGFVKQLKSFVKEGKRDQLSKVLRDENQFPEFEELLTSDKKAANLAVQAARSGLKNDKGRKVLRSPLAVTSAYPDRSRNPFGPSWVQDDENKDTDNVEVADNTKSEANGESSTNEAKPELSSDSASETCDQLTDGALTEVSNLGGETAAMP